MGSLPDKEIVSGDTIGSSDDKISILLYERLQYVTDAFLILAINILVFLSNAPAPLPFK